MCLGSWCGVYAIISNQLPQQHTPHTYIDLCEPLVNLGRRLPAAMWREDGGGLGAAPGRVGAEVRGGTLEAHLVCGLHGAGPRLLQLHIVDGSKQGPADRRQAQCVNWLKKNWLDLNAVFNEQ